MAPAHGSYWNFISSAWDDLSDSLDDYDFCLAVQSKYRRDLVLIYAAHLCQSEICNGGWMQFFSNSSGILGPEACAGFEAIGMPKIGQICWAACATLDQPYPRARQKRWQALVRLTGKTLQQLEAEVGSDDMSKAIKRACRPPQLGALDRQFYANIDTENGGFEAAADAYVNTLPQVP